MAPVSPRGAAGAKRMQMVVVSVCFSESRIVMGMTYGDAGQLSFHLGYLRFDGRILRTHLGLAVVLDGAGDALCLKAALFINGKDVGALAVQTMYDKLKNGKDFPAEAFAPTTMVDRDSWKSAGLTCG